VAGIIGAAGDNAVGIAGVAYGVKVMPIKALDCMGSGFLSDIARAITYAADNGARIVNVSLGASDASATLQSAVNYALSKNVVVIAAAGNCGAESGTTRCPSLNAIDYPAAYPGVIAVGAVNELSAHWPTSNQGAELDFVAPGVKVVSTDLHDDKFLSYVRAPENKVYVTRHLNGSKEGGVTAEYINCGLGTVNDFPAAVQGKIALIQRGGDTFGAKAKRAKQAGAVGVVIYNHNDTGIVWTLLDNDDPEANTYPWPITIGMTLEDGQALIAQGGGRITIGYDPDDYSPKTGTSMATPHVAGAVAMLWGLAPDATPAQIYNALVSTAKDLGTAGKDDKFGYGLIDLFAAAKMLAPEAFEDTPPPPGRSGRRFLRRGH
jgi:serine protease